MEVGHHQILVHPQVATILRNLHPIKTDLFQCHGQTSPIAVCPGQAVHFLSQPPTCLPTLPFLLLHPQCLPIVPLILHIPTLEVGAAAASLPFHLRLLLEEVAAAEVLLSSWVLKKWPKHRSTASLLQVLLIMMTLQVLSSFSTKHSSFFRPAKTTRTCCK